MSSPSAPPGPCTTHSTPVHQGCPPPSGQNPHWYEYGFSLLDERCPRGLGDVAEVTSLRTIRAWTGRTQPPAGGAVLSIGRLGASGGADYYLEKVANNVDDYYLGRGEAPDSGSGRRPRARRGRPGRSGGAAEPARRQLSARRGLGLQLRRQRRPGYDLTFSAPKGVSLLWAFGSAEVRDTISVAHDQAVGGVLDSCPSKRPSSSGTSGRANGRGQRVHRRGFRHRTSRAGDPQLHTHVVMPTLVKGSDGRWSAPDGRRR